jgi:hypothetical protein
MLWWLKTGQITQHKPLAEREVFLTLVELRKRLHQVLQQITPEEISSPSS